MLTAADVEQKTFSTALRGYDLDEVDDFLDEVVATLKELGQQLEEARAGRVETAAVITPAPAPEPEEEQPAGQASGRDARGRRPAPLQVLRSLARAASPALKRRDRGRIVVRVQPIVDHGDAADGPDRAEERARFPREDRTPQGDAPVFRQDFDRAGLGNVASHL